MSKFLLDELLAFPEKPYEKTELYKDSIRLKQLMFHIVTKELDRRARFRDGEDLAYNCGRVCRILIKIYIEVDVERKRELIVELMEEATDAIVTLRAIDNEYVHMSKESYTAMLGILVKYISACKSILSIKW